MLTYIIGGCLLFLNLLAFFFMGRDKAAAERGARRTPETTLLALAVIGGSAGALLGMGVFHHKTKHKKFTIGVPLLTLLNYAVIGAAVWFYSRK